MIFIYLSVIENPPKLTDEVVKTNYEQIIKNVLPFLQVLPQMFQKHLKLKKTNDLIIG